MEYVRWDLLLILLFVKEDHGDSLLEFGTSNPKPIDYRWSRPEV